MKSDIIGPTPACSELPAARIAAVHLIPGPQPRKLEIPESGTKQRAQKLLTDNFGASCVFRMVLRSTRFALRPVLRRAFLRRKRIRLRSPRAAFSAFAVLGLPPATPNLSNRQPPELESSLSPRKQRAEVFLIANFGRFFALPMVLRRAFFFAQVPRIAGLSFWLPRRTPAGNFLACSRWC